MSFRVLISERIHLLVDIFTVKYPPQQTQDILTARSNNNYRNDGEI